MDVVTADADAVALPPTKLPVRAFAMYSLAVSLILEAFRLLALLESAL
jgi:hypothetical protein